MTSGSTYTNNNIRYQNATHYFRWYQGYDDTVAGVLTCDTVENNRYPSNQLIYNPGSVTGSFDAEGNLVISAYHYNVGKTIHTFEFKFIGQNQGVF